MDTGRAMSFWEQLNGSAQARPRLPSVVEGLDDDGFDDDDDEHAKAGHRIGVVHGLTSRHDLNDKLGRAVKWVAKKSRWAVIMVESGEKVLVRNTFLDLRSARALSATKQLIKPAIGLPVAAAEPAPFGSPKPPASAATGSPGHPAEGLDISDLSLPAIAEKGETPFLNKKLPPASPVVTWAKQVAHCFCLPLMCVPPPPAVPIRSMA